MKRCCTGLALLVLLAGCGGDDSPSAPSTPAPTPTPVPINGLLVMVSSAGFFHELTSQDASGQTCGKLWVGMSIQETQGGPCRLLDMTLVLTDKTGVRVDRKSAWGADSPTVEAHKPASVFTDSLQCLVLPATWDLRVNTADVSGNVTQLHGSGQVEIRLR